MQRYDAEFHHAIVDSLSPEALAQLQHAARAVADAPPTIIAAIWSTTTLRPEHAPAFRTAVEELAERYGLDIEIEISRTCAVRFSKHLSDRT